MPEISVIIPFKDRLEWVEESIKSVLRQTFQDFEIILVDDGSELENRTRFEGLDHRIIYIRQNNRGPAIARNVGIQHAQGNYIAFLDSDDLYMPEKLEFQHNLMKQKNAGFSHTSYQYINTDGISLDIIHSGTFDGNLYPYIYQSCPVATPTVMIKRELLKESRFSENLRIAEDVILWAQLSKHMRFLGIDIPLTQVRLHGANAAFDSNAQIQGLSNILRYAVLPDKSIGFIAKRIITSNLYLATAKQYYLRKELNHFLRFFLLAFVNAPFNIRIYKHIVYAILFPKPVRNRIKQYLKR